MGAFTMALAGCQESSDGMTATEPSTDSTDEGGDGTDATTGGDGGDAALVAQPAGINTEFTVEASD
jgi:hypothetical protein